MSTKKNILWFGAVFILILSVITFVFIPTSRASGKNGTPVFGKWNGKPIEYAQGSYFNRQVQAISNQMQSQGQEVNQYSYYQIMQTAFNSSVIRLAVLDELNKVGFKIPQSSVNKNLVKYYLDSNGKYSAKQYQSTPESDRNTYRMTMTEELTAERYTDDFFGRQSGIYGLKTSSKETDLIKTMSSPERSFNYVSFATTKYPESETIAYGKANPALFIKHNLSIITVDTEAVAKKVADTLAKKKISFEDAVTTYSTRTKTDAAGKLTDSFRNDLNSLFSDAKDLETVLALKPGEISKIVKAGSTFVIVRCDAAPVDPDFTNTAVIAAVTTYMNTNERGKIEDYFMAKAKEFSGVARTSGFDAAVKAAGLEKKTTTAFGINFGNLNIMAPIPFDKYPEFESAQKSESFFKTAFGMAPTDISDPILLGSNVVVLQVAEEKAADPQILEMAPQFYGYYASSWSQQSMSAVFLKSKKLEDNFMTTYLKYFLN